MLRAATAILGKDLRLRLRDRSVLLFAFVLPFGLIALFSLILPETGELELRAAVADADGGEVAAAFVGGVVPALVDAGVVQPVQVADADAARVAVSQGDADVAWIIPEGFSDAVQAGRAAELQVLVAAGAVIEGEVARGVAETFAAQVRQVELAARTQAQVTQSPPSPEQVAALAEAAGTVTEVLELRDVTTAEGTQLDDTSYLAAGMAAFFVFFAVQFGVTGLLEERQLGTMPRLLASPIRPAAVQLGKLIGAFLLGIASMSVLGLASSVLLGADWGPVTGVAILVVALVLAAMGVMALVGGFARTLEQAINFQSIVAVVLGMFGGVFFPIPGEGALLRVATLISPHGWFLRGLQELSASGDWRVVVPAAGAIAAFGLVAAVPAVLLQRRSQAW